jgi:hypothetical protein
VNIKTNWEDIREHFRKCFSTNFHVSIASVDSQNEPTVTPIGSLFLNDDQSGFYFEKYPTKLPRYAGINKKVCVLAVNSGKVFWAKSLFTGKFKKYPAIKLYGELGERREATNKEKQRLDRRMSATRALKGNKYLWADMPFVREIIFTKAEKINLGEMTQHLKLGSQ